jgi:hypothetical protein
MSPDFAGDFAFIPQHILDKAYVIVASLPISLAFLCPAERI